MPIMLTHGFHEELMRQILKEKNVADQHGYYLEDLSIGMTSSFEKKLSKYTHCGHSNIQYWWFTKP